ncbi:MAG: alpha/beta hydrolase [Lachnospiraceae bacterium]|nr:alpha/beta hydrolase [Lachnospiraceae bacterium]
MRDIIFLHGLGQTRREWDDVCKELPKEIHPHCPDLNDFMTDEHHHYERLYQSFESYCDRFDHPVELCGLSLGAVMAINYAVDHPGVVSKLILIAPQYRMPLHLLRFQNLVFRIMPEKAFGNIPQGKSGLIQLTHSMQHLDFTKRINRISCDTHILCGEKDYANKKAAAMIADMLPGAKLYIIEKTGHEINIDNSQAIVRVIVQ